MTDAEQTARREAQKYGRVWAVPAYRVKCHSLRLWQTHRGLFPDTFESGIDIGCGLGRLLPVWLEAGIDAWGVDLVPDACLEGPIKASHRDRVFEATLWDFDPGRVFDVGVCTDVMEHIPERFVEPTLTRMARYCQRVVFKIANFTSQSLGEELHLTKRDAAWWRTMLWTSMGGAVNPVSYPTDRPEYVFTWQAS